MPCLPPSSFRDLSNWKGVNELPFNEQASPFLNSINISSGLSGASSGDTDRE